MLRSKINNDETQLISCDAHADSNSDLICDICNLKVAFLEFTENKEVKSSIVSGDTIISDNKLTVTGNMPKDTTAKIDEISKTEAKNLAKQHMKDIADEDIHYAYDISLNTSSNKYQPADFNQSVKVKISDLNLDLETSKTYAMLHIKEDETSEILPIDKITENEIEFTATSFSTYIIITVGSNSITFDGENFKVYDTEGNEITNGATVADGTNFNFVIIPNDGYGVTDINCVNAVSESVIITSGYVKSRGGLIESVTDDLTVYVTTALAPQITTQPISVKVTQGGTATFTVSATGINLTYQWQYRENEDSFWKDVNTTLGINYATATFILNNTTFELSGYEFRCLVGDSNFTENERVASDKAIAIIVDEIAAGELPIILEQSTMDKAKVDANSGIAEFTVKALGSDLTFTWQYRENRDDCWRDVTSNSIGSATTTVIDPSTSNPIQASTFKTSTALYSMAGYEFRCAVGNNFYTGDETVKSDIVVIVVTDSDISEQVQYLNPEITKHPESQKVALGDSATFTVTTEGVDTYRWKYKASGDIFWTDCDSTMSKGYNTDTLVVDTAAMVINNDDLSVTNNMSGYQFKCVVSNSSVATHTKDSDAALLTVAQEAVAMNVLIGNYSVNGAYYPTLADAYAGITGTEGTIVVERDNEDGSSLSIAAGKKVTIDTNGKTVTRTATTVNEGKLIIDGTGTIQTLPVESNTIESLIINTDGEITVKEGNLINKGKTSDYYRVIMGGDINIEGGTIKASPEGSATSTALARTINVYTGTLNVTGGTIIAGGSISSRAIEEYGEHNGNIKITGGEIISSGEGVSVGGSSGNNGTTIEVTGGTITADNYGIVTFEVFNGNVTVTGGTIKAKNKKAISNLGTGTVTIGTKDSNVSTINPQIIGGDNAIAGNGFNFYDGILKWTVAGISSGTKLVDIEPGCEVVIGIEIVEDTTYQTAYLKKTPTLTAKPLPVTITYGTTTEVELTYSGDGTLGVTSATEDVAKASISGDKVIVKSVAKGETTLTVTLAETDEYAGSKVEIPVTVVVKNISELTGTLSLTTYEYDGKAKEPVATVKYNDETLELNVDYTVAYANNVNVGSATATIIGIGNYEGSLVLQFEIVDTGAPTNPVIDARIGSYDGEVYTLGKAVNESVVIELTSTDTNGIKAYEWSTSQESGFTTEGITMIDEKGRLEIETELNQKIYFRAQDNVGNYSEPSSIAIKIDKTAPTGAVSIRYIYEKDGIKYTNSNNLTIDVMVEENMSQTEKLQIALINEDAFTNIDSDYSITWMSCEKVKTWNTSAGDGLKRIYFIFKDEAGNQSMYFVD